MAMPVKQLRTILSNLNTFARMIVLDDGNHDVGAVVAHRHMPLDPGRFGDAAQPWLVTNNIGFGIFVLNFTTNAWEHYLNALVARNIDQKLADLSRPTIEEAIAGWTAAPPLQEAIDAFNATNDRRHAHL